LSRGVWLASYPKSGNTWFRLLAANLRADAPVDINALPEQGGIASARAWFDDMMLFPSGLLTHEECDRLRPGLYEAMAQEGWPSGEEPAAPDQTLFIKTHDAWTCTAQGVPLLGRRPAAKAAILIVRDPRDVAPSLANHSGQTIDQSIDFMADPEGVFCGRSDRQHGQLRQQLPGWSGFNRSWLDQREIPVHLVRYEDLHADTAGAFSRALAFAGFAATQDEVRRAVEFASFGVLQAQELRNGFREAPPRRSGPFFRRGEVAGWRHELATAQAARIEESHAEMMGRLGYIRTPPRRLRGDDAA
jgi:hypothetical protein